MAITWKTMAAPDGAGSILANARAASKDILTSIGAIADQADPTQRQAAEKTRRGEESLRSAVADISKLKDLGALTAAEEGYGDAALQANSPFLSAEQREDIRTQFETTLGREKERVIGEGLKIGGMAADQERSLESGVENMRAYLQEQGLGEADVNDAISKLDPHGLRAKGYAIQEAEDVQKYVSSTPITSSTSNASIEEMVAKYPGRDREAVRARLTAQREGTRADEKYSQQELHIDTLDEAQAYYRSTGDRAGALQRIADAGLENDSKALAEFGSFADQFEKLSPAETADFNQAAEAAEAEMETQSAAAQNLLDTQQANYDAKIDVTPQEVQQEADRFASSGVGIIELLNKPAENAGIIKRIINVDVQFNDAAAVALGDQLQKMVAKGVPEDVAAVYLKKAMAKNYGANQAILSGTGVDPAVLNKSLNAYTQNYLDAEEDRNNLATNKKAKVALDRQLRNRKSTFLNAYTKDIIQQKATGKDSNLDNIIKEYQRNVPSFGPAAEAAKKVLQDEVRQAAAEEEEPASDKPRNKSKSLTSRERMQKRKADNERNQRAREKRSRERIAKAARKAGTNNLASR